MRLDFVLFAVTLAACSGAAAGSALQLSPKTTMNDVLISCSSNDPNELATNCGDVFDGMLIAIYDAAGGPKQDATHPICLPDVHEAMKTFRPKVLAFLRSHPELRALTINAALYRLTTGIYGCK